MEDKSLYIHIPFCNKICYYCDFNKMFYNTQKADEYVSFLVSKLEQDSNIYKTIYVGGGSPSSLNHSQLEKLLKALSTHISLTNEFSIEINPTDIDLEKILIMKKYGVNRISIGVQTFNDLLLKSINRDHSKKQVLDCINLLKENGFDNISCDLMFGIKNQTKQDILNDLDILVKYDIKHISTYALLIEPNTYFDIKKYHALEDDLQADYYELIYKYLKENGYDRYEVSNFAKPGYESKHNLVYWNAKEYKCYGPGASGYEDNVRYTYTKSFDKYIKEETVIDSETIDQKGKEYEYIILHLRLQNGIDLEDYKNTFKQSFEIKYKSIIDKLIKDDLCILENNHFYVKENKVFILNTILSYF